MSWKVKPTHEGWCTAETTRELLGGTAECIPSEWVQECAIRFSRLRTALGLNYIGLDKVIDLLLACLIARENALLLGPPGVAKTELATRIFKLLGLSRPSHQFVTDSLQESMEDWLTWWDKREAEAKKEQKYFWYTLSRFTQPEELFGPIEISLLRKGILARVNFGLLTSPGVRAAFIDEIFKASASILNGLLTLTQERKYFNWGGMIDSDLLMLIGASNEMPGGFWSGIYGMNSGLEDFETLYAFIDRFPLRLLIPVMSGSSSEGYQESDLAKAAQKAINRESSRFSTGQLFEIRPSNMPCINDVLLLGRACMESDNQVGDRLFNPDQVTRFWGNFLHTTIALQAGGTTPVTGNISWTISPRKIKALYKIALAHAVVRQIEQLAGGDSINLGEPEFEILRHIWDTPQARDELDTLIDSAVHRHYGS